MLTDNDKKALGLLQSHGGTLQGAAAVGILLYPEPREDGPKYRKNQGLGLAAAKVMRRLNKKGFVQIRSNDYCRCIYSLTSEGAALNLDDA